MHTVSDSPPRAPSIKYNAPLGTRWAKEKAAAGGAAAFDLPTDPKAVGPWILGECVGKGASGRVKIAKHRRTGKLAAVKILPIAPLFNSRASLATQQAKSDKQRLGIDREITMMKLMNHPNIMHIYDVYEGEKELFLVFEYVEGGELFDFLVNRGKLPPDEALIYFRQIVYGLNYAHTFSIIHRDLKPENILIASLTPPLIKIADWGMAAFAPPSLQLETSCGSPHYASPEIVNGEKYQGNATDIWSCGVILYALLTGRLPFDDKNVRTLLAKVKSGKYEMPPWIDPLAKDLLSKMLVVDVKQRITIPQILSHPWLVSQAAIPFSACNGKTYALLPPPLPPSPSFLARPISSANMIDPELLSSLRIIWGRHTDVHGESICRDLCSPAGQGVHAKAFYYLLGKYRQESSKNCFDSEFESLYTPALDSGIMRSTSLLVESSASSTSGLRRYEVPNHHASSVCSSPVASSGHSTLVNGQPPIVISRKRIVTGGNRPTSKERSDLNPTSRPVSHNKVQFDKWKTQILPPPKEASVSNIYRPKVTLTGVETGLRPHPPRRGNTYSVFSDRRDSRRDSREITPIGFSQQLQRLQAKTAAATASASASSYQKPKTLTGPSPSEAVRATEHVARNSVAVSRQPRLLTNFPSVSNGSGRFLTPATIATELEPPFHTETDTTKPQARLTETATGKTSIKPHAPAHGPQKTHSKSDKENHGVEEEWSHVEVTDRAGSKGLCVGDVPTNREVGKDVKNVGPRSFPPSKMKKEKERKGRPPPLELPSINQKRSTLSMLGSPISVSSPIHPPLSATRIMTPVVGDFKGWFSNLFNWRNSSSNGIIYSPDNVQKTQTDVVRILEGMGIIVSTGQPQSGHQHRTGYGEALCCRLEHSHVDVASGLAFKQVRFRVEFRDGIPEPQGTMPPIGEENLYLSAPFRQVANLSSVNSPVTPNQPGSASGLVTFRPRTSLLLGGRSFTTGNPLPSPALLSGSTKVDSSFPPGCLCAMALIHEKGSITTFRHVWKKLKEQYGDPANGYPCFSPTIPNTPHIEIYGETVV